MEIKKITIQKFLKWLETAPADAEFTCNTVKYDRHEFAKLAGLDIPKTKTKHKKQINTDIEEKSYADLEQPFHSGDTEEHGDGDSKSTE